MVLNSAQVVTQLRQLIFYHLDCNLFSNALFVAGRLHAYEPRAAEAQYLVALCHLRLGQLKSAYEHSKNAGSRGTHLGCSYVFAQACMGLTRYMEGITALERSKSLWSTRNSWNKCSDTRRQHLPDAAAVKCLLGKLLTAFNERSRAVECFSEALRENPFMWDAFTGLCDLGVEVNVPAIFKMTPDMANALGAGPSEETPLGSLDDAAVQTHLGQQAGQSQAFTESLGGTSRANGEVRKSEKTALFEKMNPSTNLFTPNTSVMEILSDDLETPTGLAGGKDLPPLKAKEALASIREDRTPIEPPLAPARKSKAPGLPIDWTSEAPPPRMKTSSFRSKGKLHDESKDADSGHLPVPSVFTSSMTERKRTVSGHAALGSTASTSSHTTSTSNDPMAPQRRSTRLLNSLTRPQTRLNAGTASARETREVKKAKPVSTKSRATHSTVGRVVSGNRKHGDPMDLDAKETKPEIRQDSRSTTAAPAPAPVLATHKVCASEKSKEQDSLLWLLDLFQKTSSGYYALSRFNCAVAFAAFSQLPHGQRETPWVLAQIGRTLYEQQHYAEAEKYFARMKALAPSRLDDLDVYSSVLWHQKSEVDLAFLAHEALDADRLSPQAWCAVGNSFNLARDHDNALKCFRRATQLDPTYAYAWTLQGHEHVANEEFDKALAAFRRGLGASARHYQAWYGLAQVYEKQGKYQDAEQHYQAAVQLNPTSGVLQCCLGGVMDKQRRPQLALQHYEKSIQLAPHSSMARYRKARALMSLARPADALADLRVLKDLAPDESQVHFLLGRVYKALRQRGLAVRHFTTALNLDPKVCISFVLLRGRRLTQRAGFAPHQRNDGRDGGRRRGLRRRYNELIYHVMIRCDQGSAPFSVHGNGAGKRFVGSRSGRSAWLPTRGKRRAFPNWHFERALRLGHSRPASEDD